MKIVLDAGHGGKDPGAKTFLTVEKDMALTSLAGAGVSEKKSRSHHDRQTDEYVSLSERCRIAKRANADIFVPSILTLTMIREQTGLKPSLSPAPKRAGLCETPST